MRIVFFVIYLSISIGGFAQNDTSSIVPDSLTLGTAPHLPKKKHSLTNCRMGSFSIPLTSELRLS